MVRKYILLLTVLFLFSFSAYANVPDEKIAKSSFYNLPCMSIGSPNGGRLINGRPLPKNPNWITRSPERQFATPEMIEKMITAVKAVKKKYPKTCRVVTGDISRKNGGPMLPHVSHQAGRDIDVGMYAKNNREMTNFEMMTPATMDEAKTWTLIEALLSGGAVEYVLVDYSLQQPLYNYVKFTLNAPDSYLDTVFQFPYGKSERRGIIRHAGGHRNHLHVRFFSPKAVAAGRQYDHLDPALAALNDPGKQPAQNTYTYHPLTKSSKVVQSQNTQIPAGSITTVHTVAEGESLWTIAARYQTSVNALRIVNDLSDANALKPGMKIKVYITDKPEPPQTPLVSTQSLMAQLGKSVLYEVKENDTLWTIAQDHGLQIADLCRENNLSFKANLEPGFKLLLPRRIPAYVMVQTHAVTTTPITRGVESLPGAKVSLWVELWYRVMDLLKTVFDPIF